MAALLQDKHWSFFDEEVNRHYLKFTTKKNVNIFIGTWNVNAKEPKDHIKSWLVDPEGKFTADIYVCGFQEIVDLNAANLWIENTANVAWEEQIESCLKVAIPQTQFVLVDSRHLVGILLCVFARKSLITSNAIQNVMSSILGVGLFGTVGNKGGVGIRMQIYDSDVCFICSHLAAHKNNVQGRNQDYLKIIENMKFSPSGKAQKMNEQQTQHNKGDPNSMNNGSNGPSANASHYEEDEDEELLSVMSHHDMVFWLGDLNYRLNLDDLEDVFKKVHDKKWTELLQFDQLKVERDVKKQAFHGFVEEEIDFRPTYKFQPGTAKYERRPDKKKRFPAWCDRILWRRGSTKTTDISDVKCRRYSSSEEQTMSDHKPVFAHLEFAANVFDKQKRKEIKQQIMKKKDKNDNNQLPQIEIEPEVSFPLIKFGDRTTEKFIIRNTGHVPVVFRFDGSAQAEHKDSLPRWLKIHPRTGSVRPQDTLSIDFEISVTSEVVRDIHGKRLEETVLLRIENSSPDNVVPMKFVVVTAKYLPSCFGNKIENLVKYRKPIRYIEDINDDESKLYDKNQRSKQMDNGVGGSMVDADEYTTSIESTLSIPKELWRLVDHLYKYGLVTANIFIERGINTEISVIRECLDTGKAFTQYEMHSVGEALVRFLESLQDPVFPESLCASYKEKEMDLTQWCRQALMRLPLSHYNCFIYIISFLREVLKHSSANKLTADKLAYMFLSALMQTSMDVKNLSTCKPFKILRHFLSSDLFL